MITSYKDMPKKLQRYNDFNGSSVTAFNDGKYYIVKSYKTQILKVDIENNTAIYNDTYYSNTTSKIQRLIKDNILQNLQWIKYYNNLKEEAIL